MTSTVIINDFETNRRTLSILEDADFNVVNGVWENEDPLLVEMQNNPFFAGRRRWCDLDPTHYRLMILRNLTQVAQIGDDERGNENNLIVRSLHFLLCAMIHCLQRRAESMLELVRINRLNEHEITFDYTATLNMHIEMPKPKAGKLFVVVDNDKTL
jgi:hypothetical protein